MLTEQDNIKKLYNTLKAKRGEYLTLWQDISDFTSLVVDPKYSEGSKTSGSQQLDQYVDDPTAALSVFTAADYLLGIVWGLGGDAFEIKPSQALLEISEAETLKPYFDYITTKTLAALAHPESGLSASLKSYFQDQYAFGTSGLGVFKNPAYLKGQEENPLLIRNYGVDNIAIDEGKNGLVEYIFISYIWRVNQIVNQFCVNDKGVIDDKLLATLPEKIKDAWESANYETEFKIIHGVYPREDYNPRLRGKRGAKYKGVWFTEDEGTVFAEEDYKTIPIAVCRQTRVRGEVYGRSAGTILISSIKTINYAIGQVIEILEKMNNPAMLLANNALIGDSVLDTSAEGIVIFNESLLGNSKSPVSPMYDVGDPTPIINWLEPYLNQKITSAFKIDLLLDFNSRANMTASESTQRYIIRGQSLSGMLQQQFSESVYPVARRAISLLMDMNELGVNPVIDKNRAASLREENRIEQIVPDGVVQLMASGRQWYEIIPNERVRKMMQTEKLEALLQFINAVTMVASLNPQVLGGVDFYGLLQDVAQELNVGVDRLIGEREYKAMIEAQNQAQAQASQLQAMQIGAQTGKDIAHGRKLTSESVKP